MVQFNYASLRLYPELQKAYYLCQILRAPLSMAQNSFSQWTVKQFTILKLMCHRVGVRSKGTMGLFDSLPQYASRQQRQSYT